LGSDVITPTRASGDWIASTVEAHREHIKERMGFKNSSELLRYAFESLLKKG
jgi:FixJ family two-component response regulator